MALSSSRFFFPKRIKKKSENWKGEGICEKEKKKLKKKYRNVLI